MPDVMNESK